MILDGISDFISSIFSIEYASGYLHPVLILSMVLCLLGLCFGGWLMYKIIAMPGGGEELKKIAGAIQQGASAYLNRQYSVIAVVGGVLAVGMYVLFGIWVSLGFVIGAMFSGLAGYVGMLMSVRANVRTAHSAAVGGLEKAFLVAFRSGASIGMVVVSGALLSVVGYIAFLDWTGISPFYSRTTIDALVALGFGASLISIFARLGGGIFTKGADVGADLVGKIEAGIPEDDPRNPAVIADNVGDNVGDCAGMAADLFETYVVSIIASMVFGLIMFDADVLQAGSGLLRDAGVLVSYPLMIAMMGIIGTIVGVYFARLSKKPKSIDTAAGALYDKSSRIMGALYKAFTASAVLSFLGIFGITMMLTENASVPLASVPLAGQSDVVVAYGAWELLTCVLIGILITAGFIVVTEYYTSTSYGPVKRVAKASLTGHATNIIQGLAVGMESTALPALIICAGIAGAFASAGLFGISVAVVSMLSLMGIVIALDAYGPITDNAGGIAEMSGMPSDVREVTDALDAVGNTTKAVTKGYAIGSAALGALVLFGTFVEEVRFFGLDAGVDFQLGNPFVVIGLILGGLLPFLFSSMTMRSVGVAAASVVQEVREQFANNPGIMQGTSLPDYSKTVDALTKQAIKEMILPSLLPVLAPVVVYFVVYFLVGNAEAISVVGSMLLGVIVTGFYMAISMTTGGGAWDNGKKYIEEGAHGGKGSLAHEAAITGDTVGDPYKDTAGPAINPMIKVSNIVALLLLSFLSH